MICVHKSRAKKLSQFCHCVLSRAATCRHNVTECQWILRDRDTDEHVNERRRDQVFSVVFPVVFSAVLTNQTRHDEVDTTLFFVYCCPLLTWHVYILAPHDNVCTLYQLCDGCATVASPILRVDKMVWTFTDICPKMFIHQANKAMLLHTVWSAIQCPHLLILVFFYI